MNTGPLKSYAIQARKDFIQAVTDRAAQLGITKATIAPVQTSGAQATAGSDKGVVVIAGTPFPSSVVHARELVVSAIERDGFRAVIEQVAYTWFNRFVALRYMEVHGYLDHGLRVLSDPNGGAVPEAVARLRDLDLPTLNKPKAVELAMDGTQDEALYRLILLAQCKHLATSMPWLFDTRLHEGVDLLLPDHLLATDSLVNELVTAIPEDNWKQGVEIIGWLYQFFISERKDEVIGSVVAPEDIPAATQLFTPNWIVQYLVQNSVGRLWMESYPNSTLRQYMPYYIEPAQQDPEVQAELDKLIVRDRTPESLTVLDPACGSGHILVEAFRLLFQIYLERGHREREIPRLILANNLFGLDIDDRAEQLACMTLLFEARRHDVRIFTSPPTLRVMAIQQSRDSDLPAIESSAFLAKTEAKALVNLFREAKTLGSLLRVTEHIYDSLSKIRASMPVNVQQRDFITDLVTDLMHPLLTQAELLSRQYDVVVTNPPYMGGKGMSELLRAFGKSEYSSSCSDTYSMFIERGILLTRDSGLLAYVTMQNWLFLSSFEDFRRETFYACIVESLVQIGYNSFPSLNSKIALAVAFIVRKNKNKNHLGIYIDLNKAAQNADKEQEFLKKRNAHSHQVKLSQFQTIPGMPIAYWASKAAFNSFSNPKLSTEGNTRRGLQTGNKDLFIRYWFECDRLSVYWNESKESAPSNISERWFIFNNGGEYRKWFGNIDLVVNWMNNGYDIKNSGGAIIPNESLYFKEAVCWTRISSGPMSFRLHPKGVIPGDLSPCLYSLNSKISMGYLNSKCASYFMDLITPALTKTVGDVARIPAPIHCEWDSFVEEAVSKLISISKSDYNASETSINFARHPFVGYSSTIPQAWESWINLTNQRISTARELEYELNKIYISAYGLENDVDPIVSDSAISLRKISQKADGVCNPHADVCGLISFAVGCMMGRYSTEIQGLVYAGSGGIGFDNNKYGGFPADVDGIIPITEQHWFSDDTTERLIEFIGAIWPKKHLDENVQFISDALNLVPNDPCKDSIRRYFSNYFYQDHCQRYKKRPIYWLFSSGKQQAFQCLVYLHRYSADTLGRMRADYVIPLQGKLQGRLTTLTEEVARAESTAQRKQAQKALDLIDKKIRELAVFEDQLRTCADKRIELDLDDGVKVNIRKFGTLIDLGPLGGADE